jgi:hypothetical protein
LNLIFFTNNCAIDYNFVKFYDLLIKPPNYMTKLKVLIVIISIHLLSIWPSTLITTEYTTWKTKMDYNKNVLI